MKIFQTIDSLQVGGAEQLLISFAQGTQQKDVDLTIVALRSADAHMQQQLESLGVNVVVVPGPGSSLLHPVRIWQLYKLLRREKPDIIHAHLTATIIICSLVGKLLSIPVICTIHNVRAVHATHLKLKHRIRQRLHRLALRQWASGVIAVGNRVAETFRPQIAPKDIEVIWNAVSPMPEVTEDQKTTLRQSVVGDAAGPILICVGRLVEAKGHLDLLDAFRKIYDQFPETRLLIAGDGQMRPDIEAKIRQDGLENAALVLGSRPDIPALLAISDLFVLASHWEGLPISILEAMASEVPVVATEVGEVSHVVVEGTGLVVPAHQPDTLADTVCQLLQTPERLAIYGQQAKAHIDQQYSIDAWVNTLLKFYQSVLEQR